MRLLKRGTWKAAIALAGLLALLGLMVVIPLSASVYAGTSGPPQATPTVDVTATITALNEEKLRQEIQQLMNQNEPDFFSWIQANATLLSAFLVVAGGLVGLWRWFADKQSERDKRAEERFQAAVMGLGGESEGAKIGAAILLRTFLRPSYNQFYTQVFDLAVANLRLRNIDPENPEPLNSLNQALIVVFKEAFPLARKEYRVFELPPDERISLPLTAHIKDMIIDLIMALRKIIFPRDQKRQRSWEQWIDERHKKNRQTLDDRQLLDATGIVLDNAYFEGADLKQAWMPKASMRKASFTMSNLSWANLNETDLREADLRGASFRLVEFTKADLRGAYLKETDFSDANLSGANLSGADLTDADLYTTDLRDADLSNADLSMAWLGSTLLSGTILRGVKGLSKEQLKACKARGAIIDEDDATTTPQSADSSTTPSQNTDAQTPPLQASPSTPDTNGSSTSAPQQSDAAQTLVVAPAQVVVPPANRDGNGAASPQQGSELSG